MKKFFGVAAVLGATAACQRPAAPAKPAIVLSQLTNCVAARSAAPTWPEGTFGLIKLRDPDRQWLEHARKVPGGFAGFDYDQDAKTFVLRMVDTTQAAAARAKVQELAQTYPDVPFFGLPPAELPRARAVAVRWSLPELYEWKEYLSVLMANWSRANPTLSWGLGVSPRINRVTIQITSDDARQRLDAFIAPYNIPCELIHILAGPGPILL